MPDLPATFSYTTLDPTTRTEVEAATRRLHDLERRTSEAILEIGNGLLFVKEKLGHGQFLAWLEREFAWNVRTAQNFMRVAETFKSENFSHLKNVAPSALYALASDSTPEDVRAEFRARAAAGEQVTHKQVTTRLAARKREIVAVDRETGEILEEDEEPEIIEAEYVDPSDPATFLIPPTPHFPAREADQIRRELDAIHGLDALIDALDADPLAVGQELALRGAAGERFRARYRDLLHWLERAHMAAANNAHASTRKGS